MAVVQDHPYGNAQFLVDIPTCPQARGFDEVLLPDLLVEAEEMRDGSSPARESRKFPGQPSYSNLILSRGFSGMLDLYQWWKSAAEGDADARQTITIQLLSEDRNPVASWRLNGAFPVRYAFSPLNSLDGSPLVETLEVSCDAVTLE